MKKLFILAFLISFTPSLVFATIKQKTLGIINNNIYVYEGNKKIDSLTTRGNITQECDYPAHNPCIGYQIIKGSGTFGIVLKWVQYDGIENVGPSIFIYNFQKKNSKLVDISNLLYKKYGFDNLLNFHLIENKDGTFTLDTYISDERGMSIADAKRYGFRIGKIDEGKGTNARLIIPVSFFKDIVQDISSVIKDYAISENYRFHNGKVQHLTYINGTGGYAWYDTDIDASTATFSSPENGKDKYGSFYGSIRLKMNSKNIFVEPIGATSKLPSLYFQDGKSDNVYVMDYGFGSLNILPGARASALIVLNYRDDYTNYMSVIKKACNAHGDDSNLYDITAIDSNFCYGTFGSTPGNNIEKKTERIQ